MNMLIAFSNLGANSGESTCVRGRAALAPEREG